MNTRLVTIVLAIALAFSCVILMGSYTEHYVLPGNNKNYEPLQPINFSHRLHAGELQLACLHCHAGAEQSRNAGIPSANICMNCHRFVTAPFVDVKAEDELSVKEKRKPRTIISAELGKVYGALGLDGEMKHIPGVQQTPIIWKKIHNLPDFVYFNHSAHVNKGVTCQTCHGAVETMERVRQFSDLTMGWCVNCHREMNANGVNGTAVHASTDCTTCHY